MVEDQMQAPLALDRPPADVRVARRHRPGAGAKADRAQPAFRPAHPIAHLRSGHGGVAPIMPLIYQSIINRRKVRLVHPLQEQLGH